MNLFYSNRIEKDRLYLENEDHQHCTKVLRNRKGEQIHVTDGIGNHYVTVLVDAQRHISEYNILEKHSKPPVAPGSTIAIAPTKNVGRFEWFLEKATELGIQNIIPFISQNSERNKIRNDRLEKIILSAAKQSLQFHLPKLHPLCSFQEMLNFNYDNRYIAYLQDDVVHAGKINFSSNSIIAVGPEGGFSPLEYSMAKEHDFQGISLGNTRLRTETAGIVSAQYLCLISD